MKKSLFINLSLLIVMVAVLINAPDLLGKELYQNIMVAIGCWQVGAWVADLGAWLVRKLDVQ